MYFKITANALLILLLSIVQISFISGLPGFSANLNIILVALIFILGISGIKWTLFWVVGAGFLLDISSFQPFGIYMVSFLLMIIFAKFLLDNFFTNRSLYSFLALTFFSHLLFSLIMYTSGSAIHFIKKQAYPISFNADFFIQQSISIGLSLAASVIVYYLLSSVSASLKPVFISKK